LCGAAPRGALRLTQHNFGVVPDGCPRGKAKARQTEAGGRRGASVKPRAPRCSRITARFLAKKTLSTRCFKTTAWANYEKLELNNKKSAFLRKRGRTVLLGFH